MFRLVRWYNQNRGKIWTTILIIAGILGFIQVMDNYYLKYGNKSSTKTNKIQYSSQVNNLKNEVSGKIETTDSVISGESVSSNKLAEDIKVIDDFIQYCNNGQVEQAYNLLTEECKENLFPSMESFKDKYHKNVFSTYKIYSIYNWTGDTYKLQIKEDPLTTGKVGNSSAHLQEYITVVENDSEFKLNINSYIGRTEINKKNTLNELVVTVINKDTYMDYEEYNIKIENKSNKTIWIDNGDRTDTIYLLDENNTKAYAHSGEVIHQNLILKPSEIRTYTFKFANGYSSSRKMKAIVFEKFIEDYEEYKSIEETYEKFKKIMINVE